VSDHIHFDYDDQYFPFHLEKLKQFKNQDPLINCYLGAEITIVDLEGHLAKLDKAKEQLDYFLVGDHYIPESHITMDDLVSSEKILKGMMESDPDSLIMLLKKTSDMYINCIHRNHPTILAHPFSTFIRCNFAHIQLIEDFENVCESLQSTQTALELNNAEIQSCFIPDSSDELVSNDILTKRDFIQQLYKVAQKYDLTYSIGSDAHLLNDVGVINYSLQLLEHFLIQKSNILHLNFDKEKKIF
jgi:histidinol phosphatase-like PHP family hydrolase